MYIIIKRVHKGVGQVTVWVWRHYQQHSTTQTNFGPTRRRKAEPDLGSTAVFCYKSPLRVLEFDLTGPSFEKKWFQSSMGWGDAVYSWTVSAMRIWSIFYKIIMYMFNRPNRDPTWANLPWRFVEWFVVSGIGNYRGDDIERDGSTSYCCPRSPRVGGTLVHSLRNWIQSRPSPLIDII